MKILFFAPHAGVWVHAFPEALVADAIRAGNELIYVTCGGALSDLCVTMASRGLTVTSDRAQKQAVCKECRGARDRLRSGFELGGYDFETMLTPEDHARVDALVTTARPDSIATFEVDGANLGRASLYEFLIERKKLRLELTPEEWALFRPRLANTVRSFVAAQRILDRERPDRVVVYNSLYSANAAWRAAANQRSIAFYFVHGGLSLHRRLERVLVGRDTTLDWWNRIIAAWPAHRDVPCSPAELAEVTEHFLKLFSGGSVFAYSAPESAAGVDVRGRFGVAPHQKLLVATMSSYDEYVAAEAVGGVPPQSSLLFPTQIDWVRALVTWMRGRPDRFLLLRVHPREFPNKRDARKSEHAEALERELTELPPNVRVNWPTDKLSIYDVAEQADVVLNAWSTAGKEMTLLGLPVVIYSPGVIQYPAELNYVGTTQDTYFAAVEQALADGWSFERIRKAFRWCVLEYVRGLVDIGDGFQFSEEPARSYVGRARNLLLAPPQVRQRYDLWRRPRVLRAQPRLHGLVASGGVTLLDVPGDRANVTEAIETAALRGEVRRLIQALYPPDRVPTKHSLHSRLAAVV
jgi:hypothetical protein